MPLNAPLAVTLLGLPVDRPRSLAAKRAFRPSVAVRRTVAKGTAPLPRHRMYRWGPRTLLSALLAVTLLGHLPVPPRSPAAKRAFRSSVEARRTVAKGTARPPRHRMYRWEAPMPLNALLAVTHLGQIVHP